MGVKLAVEKALVSHKDTHLQLCQLMLLHGCLAQIQTLQISSCGQHAVT